MNKKYSRIFTFAGLILIMFTNCKQKDFDMVFVKGGTFTMGCTDEQGNDCDDDEIKHTVTLNNYYIGKYEVTQAEYEKIMGKNPSHFKNNKNPVEQVSYDDVQRFIAKLNKRTGKNYRLPTEAEWEYAARGGRKSQGKKYSGSNFIDEVAWHSGNSYEKTHQVGRKKPNELGIYDMSGNVYEWCSDIYSDYLSVSQNDSTPFFQTERVFRGGSWLKDSTFCRTSNRGSTKQYNRTFFIGFRLALD